MNEREMVLYQSLQGLHLLQKASRHTVLTDLIGLQAQFSRNPQISLRLRASDYTDPGWDDGLVKIWTHRGTIHVLPESDLGLQLSACGNIGPFCDNFWGIPILEQERWAPFLQEQVLSGNDTRDGLEQACRNAGMEDALLEKVFYGWGGLIKEMAWRGMLVCSTGTDKRYCVPTAPVLMDRDEARTELIRRYFRSFGPATLQDCAAFFGWNATPMAEIRRLCEPVLPTLFRTTMDGHTYYHARPLQEQAQMPPCVFVPGFDQLVMGYRDRSRFLDPQHAKKLTNQAGIVFPCLILRGRVRAKWKLEQRGICITPFERLLKKDEAAIRSEAKAKFGKIEITYAE